MIFSCDCVIKIIECKRYESEAKSQASPVPKKTTGGGDNTDTVKLMVRLSLMPREVMLEALPFVARADVEEEVKLLTQEEVSEWVIGRGKEWKK